VLFPALTNVCGFNTTLNTIVNNPSNIGRVEPGQILIDLKTIDEIYSTPKKVEVIKNFTNSLNLSVMERSVTLLRDKNVLGTTPRSIPFWSMKGSDGLKILCNLTPYTKTKIKSGSKVKTVNSMSADPGTEAVSIPSPILYTFLEIAYIQKHLSDNISRQIKFTKAFSEIYSTLALNILERNYGLGGSISEFYETKVTFMVFCNHIMLGKDLKSSLELAKSTVPVGKDSLVNGRRIEKIFESADKVELGTVIEKLAEIHPRLNKLTFRLFMSSWINDYGELMTLAVDTPIYLIFNITSTLHNANLNNEFRIGKLIDPNLLGRAYLELMRTL